MNREKKNEVELFILSKKKYIKPTIVVSRMKVEVDMTGY
jgi:hypothetical protein